MSAFDKDSAGAEKADDNDDGGVVANQLKALNTLGGGEVLVILDLANLETVKTKKGEFQLLNCDDHISILGKNNKDPAKYRPDIVHQEIMAVLDSPLNKSGKCRLLVHTEKNVLFEVNPKTRIPRTFKRFSGLMVQLLHRLKIRSADGKDTLLKVVKNPISRHIPAGAHVYGFSAKGTLHSPNVLAEQLPDDKPIVRAMCVCVCVWCVCVSCTPPLSEPLTLTPRLNQSLTLTSSIPFYYHHK